MTGAKKHLPQNETQDDKYSFEMRNDTHGPPEGANYSPHKHDNVPSISYWQKGSKG